MTEQTVYRVLHGAAWRMAVVDGTVLVADDGSGLPVRVTAAGGEGLVLEGLRPGRYWLAMEPPGGELERVGVLDVEPLADPYETRLVRELADLNAQIENLDRLIEYQATNSDGGESFTRATLTSVRMRRAEAERRLTGYRNRQQGVDPVRAL